MTAVAVSGVWSGFGFWVFDPTACGLVVRALAGRCDDQSCGHAMGGCDAGRCVSSGAGVWVVYCQSISGIWLAGAMVFGGFFAGS